MRVLLTDGSGLTSRQVATVLHRAGHRVEAVAPPGPVLARLTRHVAHVHALPVYGPDPLGWYDAFAALLRREQFDAVLPTQEQVAVLAVHRDELAALGVPTAVPTFAAVRAVQDKVSATGTLTRLALPQPPTRVLGGLDELTTLDGSAFPAFVKSPIGTASGGVHRVLDARGARALAAAVGPDPAWQGSVVVQEPVDGPLVMVQSVFRHGELVALHANRRMAEGLNGGASHKTSHDPFDLREAVGRLGADLGWHGALSLDAVYGVDGPVVIDVNPRLVEPMNALRSGVDLVGALAAVTLGQRFPGSTTRPGVRTHQLLLALLGAAKADGRGGVARELVAALGRRGSYEASTEELMPWAGDPIAAVAATALGVALLVHPPLWQDLSASSVSSYALTAAGWADLCAAADGR